MEDLTGQQLGPYRIIAPLGEGGMAAVYKAYQPGVDRYVALKILPRLLADDPKFARRFQQEARTIANLQHIHILPVFDYGQDQGFTYLAMPFVETGTLADLLKGSPLPLSQVQQVVAQVGDALDYAHARGVIHRDIKPSNILIDGRGNCLLTDFGISKILSASATQLTATGDVIGTPAYMAPEQGLAQELDQRSDIYSLGVVLYEMVTGRQPFRAETPIAVIIKHINDPLPLPRSLNPAIPEAVERIILKAMAKDREQRFVTAGALAAAMHTALTPAGGEPQQVEPLPNQGTLLARQPPTSATLPAQPAGLIPQVPPSTLKATEPSLAVQQPARKAWQRLPWWLWAGLAVILVGILVIAWRTGKNPAEPVTPPEVGQEMPAAQVTPEQAVAASATLHPTEIVAPSLTPTASQTPGPTPTLGFGSTLVSPQDGMVMVYVPAGAFTMGGDYVQDEIPFHLVTLDAYWIDQTEVTNAMFAAFLNEQGNQTEGGVTWLDAGDEDALILQSGGTWQPKSGYADHPVVEVSWYGANAYCQWAGRRLPTEAEWEKAARSSDLRAYPWGDEFDCRKGNFDDETLLDEYVVDGGAGCDGYDRTAPVGSFPQGASPYGVLDLSGNVWEWVADWYASDYYSRSPESNPPGPESGEFRVLRGGSWSDDLGSLNVLAANRYWSFPEYPDILHLSIGFRCALSP